MRIKKTYTPFKFKWIGDVWFWYDLKTKEYCVTADLHSTFIPSGLEELYNGK